METMNKFERIVVQVPDIVGGYSQGLKALVGKYSQYVAVADSRSIDGSVDIDACTEDKYPAENRWDYVISYQGRAYYLEIHPATNGSVKEVEAKLKWLKNWLSQKAVALNGYPSGMPRFTWVHSGKCGLSKTSTEYKRASILGMAPTNILRLK